MMDAERSQLWIKFPLSVDEEDDYKVKLAAWWDSLGGVGLFYDVFLKEIDFGNVLKQSTKGIRNVPLIEGKECIAKFVASYRDYSHVIFYSVRPKQLIIYGNISTCKSVWKNSEIISLYDTNINSKDTSDCLKTSETEEICSLCVYSHSRNSISPVHTGLFSESHWTTMYTAKNVQANISTSMAWRMEMILSSGTSLRISKQIFDILDTIEGRKLDDETYSLCKILSMFDNYFGRRLIASEKLFCKIKLLKYHPRERDVIRLCLANNIFLTLDIIACEGPFDGKIVSDRFSQSFPGKVPPQYIFLVPFEQLPSDIPPTVELIMGYAAISYMEMIFWYFPRRVELDIQAHISKGNQEKLIRAHTRYQSVMKSMNTVPTESEILESYRDTSPLGEKTLLISQFESQIIDPLLNSLQFIRDTLKFKPHLRDDVIDIKLDPAHNSPIEQTIQSLLEKKSVNYHNGESNRTDINFADMSASIVTLMDTIDDEQFAELFPPCIRELFEIASSRHLKHQERTRLILFYFSIGLDKNTVGTIWQQLCSNSTSCQVSMNQPVEEFLKKHKYGKMVESLWKSYEKSVNANPDGKPMHYGCKSTIDSLVSKTNLSVCPYANRRREVGDIEDLHERCTSKCSEELSKTISSSSSAYSSKKITVYSPRGFFMQSFRHKLRETKAA